MFFKPISGVLISSFVVDNHGASLLHYHDYAVMTERLLSHLMTPFNYPAGGVLAKLVQYTVHDRASVASYSSFLCFR